MLCKFVFFRISFLDIVRVIEKVCAKHRSELVASPSLEEIVHFDQWARRSAAEVARTLPTPVTC